MAKAVITVKKKRPAEIGYGDHASYIRYPAHYSIFKDGKEVGLIMPDAPQTYRSGSTAWDVLYKKRKAGKWDIRPIKRFYSSHRMGGAFAQAKKFALNYKW